MAKIVVVDKNQNSIDIISSMINEIDSEHEIVKTCSDIKEVSNNNELDYDLLIFDIDSNSSNYVLDEINKIKSRNNDNIKFIALSYDIDSELVIKSMQMGVNEFLLKPLLKDIFIKTIKKVMSYETKDKNLGTICVFSSKGGVGKTVTAINLAYEMSGLEKEKVCLLDLSFNQEDSLTYLDLKSKFNPEYIIQNLDKNDNDLILSMMNRYKESNLYILSCPKVLNLNSEEKEKYILKIINGLKNIFSYIVIDTKSIIDETTIPILNSSNLILLLSTTNKTSLANSKTNYDIFKDMGYSEDKIELIINRYIESKDMTSKEIEKIVGKEIFYKLPNNYLTLVDSINSNSMVGELHKQSNISKAYRELAKRILNLDFLNLSEENKKIYNHNVFNLLRRMGE